MKTKCILSILCLLFIISCHNKKPVVIQPSAPDDSKHCDELEDAYKDFKKWCNDLDEDMGK